MADEAKAFPPKKLQTEVKHLIVAPYIGAWGGIILRGTAGAQRLALVDAFAGPGAYAADDPGQPLRPGSPVLAMDALDRLIAEHAPRSVQADALFIDSDHSHCASLRTRLRERPKGPTTWLGRQGEFADLTDEILGFTEDRFGLVVIDPFGPKGAPLKAVNALIQQPRNDVIINLPYYSLHKWSRASEKGVAEAGLFGHIRGADEFFGTDEWRPIAQGSRTPDECERRLVELYKSRIQQPGVGVISVPLLMPQAAQTIYHLVLTSRSTAGLLRMKEIMQTGTEYQSARRLEAREQREVERTGMDRLLDVPPTTTAVPEVDIDSLAEDIYREFRGRAGVEFEDVYRFGVYMEGVLKSHLGKAMTLLKSSGRATFTARRAHSLIHFSN